MAFSEQKRLFIGNLPPDIQEHELKTEFSHYGKYHFGIIEFLCLHNSNICRVCG